MRIAFAGSPEIAVRVLRALAVEHEVVAVLTREDAPVGRKRLITPSRVAQAASALSIPTLKRNRPNTDDVRWLIDQGAQICVVVAYGAILSPEVLKQNLRFLNLHFSLLPKFRGAAPVQAAILAGEHSTGVTIFEIDAGMDTGPILAQAETELKGNETTESLLEALADLALPQLLHVLREQPKQYPQVGQPSFAPKLSKVDAGLSPFDTIIEVDRKLRALGVEPGVWLDTDVGKLGITGIKIELHSVQEVNQVGEGLRFLNFDGKVHLIDGSNFAIELSQVQPTGKMKMDPSDWWRGLRKVPQIV